MDLIRKIKGYAWEFTRKDLRANKHDVKSGTMISFLISTWLIHLMAWIITQHLVEKLEVSLGSWL